jgi:outer membrane cobalamin receptor
LAEQIVSDYDLTEREGTGIDLGSGLLGSKWGYDCNLFWKYVSSYESMRFSGTPSYQPLGDFHSLNFNAGRSLGSTDATRIYVEVSNLIDSEYSTVVGYPDYGRRFLVGIRQRF